MKKMLVVFCLLVTSASAQRAINVELEAGKTENYWRSYILKLENKVPIKDVAATSEKFYLRLWVSSQIIEVWQDTDGLKGNLVNWAREQVPSGEEETGRYFFIKEALDSTACRKIYQAFQTHQLEALPSEENILGWQGGFDGVMYLVEVGRADNYYLKSYWTPQAQKDLKEAVIIQSFVDEVKGILALGLRSKYFKESIPFQSWTTDEGWSAVKMLTREEQLRMRKERNQYRNRIK